VTLIEGREGHDGFDECRQAVNTGDEPPRLDPSVIARLPLPSRVAVWVEGRWRRAWIIARSHEPSGWVGVVQFYDRGREVTAEVPAERISAAETRFSDSRPDRPRN